VRRTLSVWLCCAIAILLRFPSAALALDPRLSLSQYVHTSWIQNEGALIPSITALAQTTDGYLWLGTWEGLWRFDGLHFTRWTSGHGKALNDVIRALAPSRTSGLWIGTMNGLEDLEGGALVDYPGRSAITTGMVTALWQEPAGRLWIAAMQNGLPGLTMLDGQARRIAENVRAFSFSAGADGVIWADTTTGFYACSMSGSEPACHPESPEFPKEIRAQGRTPPDFGLVRSMLKDRDGSVWLGTEKHGLFRIHGGTVEQFARRDGLSSDSVEAILEDHEGNIWAGTANGLDRFREPKVARWSSLQGLAGDGVPVAYATHAGDLWVASVGGSLDLFRNGRIQHYNPGLDEIQTLFEDSNRTLWLGTMQGLARLNGHRFELVPVIDQANFVRTFATAQVGDTVWLADSKKGLATIRQGSIVPEPIAGLNPKELYQLAATRNGDLWIGFFNGGISVIRQGTCVHRFAPGDGQAPGAVQAIFEDKSGNVWIGTSQGLSRYRDGAWTTWTERDGLPAGGVQGVIEDLSSRIWLLTLVGLAALPAEAQSGNFGSPPRLALTVYGPGDGIRMKPVGGRVNPRITMSPDGRIWFGTAGGLAGLDPASIRMNRIPPPVEIQDLLIDGKKAALPGSGREIHGRSVEVEYTALSLTLPETVRFRYMLEPVNSSWVEAGTTRRMGYANLSPGHYKFRVTACNNDGAWNPVGASLNFAIDPRFYQTWWFAVLVTATIGLIGFAMHRGRMRLMRSRFQLILQERTRLARDMHDTLLQGFAGVIYQLAAASRLMSTAPARGQEKLAKALEQADQSLSEARQMLSSLRLSALENATLAEALRTAGEQVTSGSTIRFELSVQGQKRELPYEMQAALYIIAREAMNNAFNHAQPDGIAVKLVYSADAVSLAVRDTGSGFELHAAESRPAHWGLAGMRERARQIGGILTIQTSPGAGTTVEVTVGRQSKKLSL
jgi:ligand-binding sensor domain-containing protein/two-component sensor histidine kinase